MWRALLALAAALPGHLATAQSPLFAPVEVPAHVYGGGWEHFVGGGLAVFDCNGDALPDLVAAGGANSAMLLVNQSDIDTVRFADATPPALRLSGVVGAYPLDIDSDGLTDLAVLRVGPNLLLRGGTGCRFTQFEDLGFASGDRWTTAFSATWTAGQPLPTLAFGNYVDRADPKGPFRACDTNVLYTPDGPKYGPPALLEPGFCPLSMLFSDWNRTGRADLRLSNDRHYYVSGGQEQLWAMETPPRLYGPKDGWQNHQLWGMGIAARDLDGDGLSEVFLSSMGDQRLQRLDRTHSGPRFSDVPYELGTSAHRPYLGGDGRPSTGWHIDFGDVNNDGRDDVFIAKGNVEQMPGSAMDDPNNLLIQQPDGRFAEAGGTAGIASLHRGRGAALADFNGDGRLDLAVVNRRAPLEIWQNVTPKTGHWLSVSLRQPAPNTWAIGGWIELKTGDRVQVRELTVGGGHAGGRLGDQHFGLGDDDAAQVRVIWPGGAMSDWISTTVNRRIVVERHGNAAVIKRP